MNIEQKHFLNSRKEIESTHEGRFDDILYITDEINLVDCCLCNLLSKEINAEVYWYKVGNMAVVCVPKEIAYEATIIGKKLIIQHFNTMSAEYLIDQKKSLVFDEYSIIATFNPINPEGLSSWCNNISPELIIKTSATGFKCVLTKEPLEYAGKIKAAYNQNPYPDIYSFEFIKI